MSRLVFTVLAIALLFTPLTRDLGPAGAQSECVTVEDFAKAKIGEFPQDWKPRKDSGKTIYTVHEENGKRFLRAVAKGTGIQAAKQYDTWDLKEYPVLAWSWRPNEFPAEADERKSKTNDSALAVYAVFPHSPVTVKSLKYIWSAVAPRGTHLTDSRGLTQVRVLQSGTDRRGEWVEERVNVAEDYKKFFGETELPRPAGIAVLTDSDDTKSSAQGDYANFRVCRG
jgi:Protein of unknown function (DUF3047)